MPDHNTYGKCEVFVENRQRKIRGACGEIRSRISGQELVSRGAVVLRVLP